MHGAPDIELERRVVDEHFLEKWKPVFRRKCDQTEKLSTMKNPALARDNREEAS
jgi:hypothetical protein